MDAPSPNITHLLERHRDHECPQPSDEQQSLPDLPFHTDLQDEPSLQLKTDEGVPRTTLSIAHVFPHFLYSFDDRIPFREDPSPTSLSELWSEANSAAEYLAALAEVTQEVAGWRATYEGMGAIDRNRLHNLEVDLDMELGSETPLFGSPKDDDQIRQSLSHAKEKVEEVFRKTQDEKNMREKVGMLSQVLEAIEKVAGLVGRAATVEAVLIMAKSPSTVEDASMNLHGLEHEIEELGAYIDMQWKEIEGTQVVVPQADQVEHTPVITGPAMPCCQF